MRLHEVDGGRLWNAHVAVDSGHSSWGPFYMPDARQTRTTGQRASQSQLPPTGRESPGPAPGGLAGGRGSGARGRALEESWKKSRLAGKRLWRDRAGVTGRAGGGSQRRPGPGEHGVTPGVHWAGGLGAASPRGCSAWDRGRRRVLGCPRVRPGAPLFSELVPPPWPSPGRLLTQLRVSPGRRAPGRQAR